MIKKFLHAFFCIYFCLGSHVYPMDTDKNSTNLDNMKRELKEAIKNASYYHKKIVADKSQGLVDKSYMFYQTSRNPTPIKPIYIHNTRQPNVTFGDKLEKDEEELGTFLNEVNLDHVKIERHVTKPSLVRFYKDGILIGTHEIIIPSNTSTEDLMSIRSYNNLISKKFGPISLFSKIKTVEYHNSLYPQANLSYDKDTGCKISSTTTWQHKLAQVTACSLIALGLGGLYYMASKCEVQKLLYK